MATVIFFVALAVLIFGTFTALAFWEVAFVSVSRNPSPARLEDLPLLSGDALRQWGFDRVRQMVAAFCRQGGLNAAELGREVGAFTQRVVTTITGGCSDSAKCNRQTYRSIPVSAPETLAIVETLRNRLSKRELRRVQEIAVQNVKSLQFGTALLQTGEPLICPLLSKNGGCACHETQPLFCLTHCSCGSSTDFGTSLASPSLAPPFTAVFGEGIAQGFTAGLKEAGLNSRLYELNSALADALGDAA